MTDVVYARKVVARIAPSLWGWEWKDPNHIKALSDDEVISNLILLADRTHSIREVYADMISRALKHLDKGDADSAYKSLTWREDMGK